MFSFMKKGVASAAGGTGGDRDKADRDEKERRKREKKLRKEAKGAASGFGSGGVSGSMSSEELLRLDEVRRSLKIRGRRKEKEKLPSGITADYSADFFAALNADSGGSGYELDRGNEEILATITTTIDGGVVNGSGASVNVIHSNIITGADGKLRCLPPIPPKPPKRGILKGSRSNITNINEEGVIASPEAHMVVMRNTMQNELVFNTSSSGGSGSGSRNNSGGAGGVGQYGTSFTSVESLRSDECLHSTQRAMTLPATSRYSMDSPQSNLRILTSPSPSADSLTDTTNSSFATPPFSLSPVGESQGTENWSRVHRFEDIDLPLPSIKLVPLPPPRELVIKRQKSPRQDFGFSLRKAICLDRNESLTSPVFRPVIFAEPGAGGGSTGLLPGDRLLKVNGTSVSELTREIIIEMIRNSGDAVTVEVQPVSELVELSLRCMPQGSYNKNDEVDRAVSNGNCNTLRNNVNNRWYQQVFKYHNVHIMALHNTYQ